MATISPRVKKVCVFAILMAAITHTFATRLITIYATFRVSSVTSIYQWFVFSYTRTILSAKSAFDPDLVYPSVNLFIIKTNNYESEGILDTTIQ